VRGGAIEHNAGPGASRGCRVARRDRYWVGRRTLHIQRAVHQQLGISVVEAQHCARGYGKSLSARHGQRTHYIVRSATRERRTGRQRPRQEITRHWLAVQSIEVARVIDDGVAATLTVGVVIDRRPNGCRGYRTPPVLLEVQLRRRAIHVPGREHVIVAVAVNIVVAHDWNRLRRRSAATRNVEPVAIAGDRVALGHRGVRGPRQIQTRIAETDRIALYRG